MSDKKEVFVSEYFNDLTKHINKLNALQSTGKAPELFPQMNLKQGEKKISSSVTPKN